MCVNSKYAFRFSILNKEPHGLMLINDILLHIATLILRTNTKNEEIEENDRSRT